MSAKTQMKITICTRKFVPPNLVGGVDVYADRLGRAFQRLGHSVHFLAVDAQAEIGKEPFALAHDDHHGMPVTRLKFAFSDRPKEYFDVCHDPDVGRVVRDILQEDRPDLFIVMNFYTITLSVVEAAKSLGIPVVHVATDFLPICRRATLIRWNNEACRTGESVKSCSECFVSRDALGRVAAAAMAPLDETTLVRIARGNPGLPNPLALLKPYWEQVKLMDERIELLRPLRRALSCRRCTIGSANSRKPGEGGRRHWAN